MLFNKYPVYTMCFVCLALYGLSMMLFFQRDKETQESEPWVEKKTEVKQKVRETPVQEVQKLAKKEKAPVATPKAAQPTPKAKPAKIAEPVPAAPEPQPVKAKAPVKSKPP